MVSSRIRGWTALFTNDAPGPLAPGFPMPGGARLPFVWEEGRGAFELRWESAETDPATVAGWLVAALCLLRAARRKAPTPAAAGAPSTEARPSGGALEGKAAAEAPAHVKSE